MKTIIMDYPDGGRLISNVPLSPEAFKGVEQLLEAGKLMNQRMREFDALIPDGCTHQFYGNWDCIIIREPRQDNLDQD